ncbi:PHP domain-containing protein [Candidatus Aerophobetes bacterium]|nr:PHP domain-containing protein [Candidatus Aerophobetes bacterium]
MIRADLECDLKKRGWYSGDAHLHTTYSDGKQTVEEIGKSLREANLNWAVLTDHNTLKGKEEWLNGKRDEFIPIMGEEITTKFGHFNGINIKEFINPQTSEGLKDIKRIFEEIHSQGGLVQINHPLTKGLSYQGWEVSDYDLLEIWNGLTAPNLPGMGNYEAKLKWFDILNSGKRLAATANSDTHDVLLPQYVGNLIYAPLKITLKKIPHAWKNFVRENIASIQLWARRGIGIGMPRTYLYLPKLTLQNILIALKRGNSFLSNGPLLLINVNGKIPGERIDLQTKEKLILRVKLCSFQSINLIKIIKDGLVIDRCKLPQGTKKFELSLELKEQGPGWLVVECYGSYPFYAITNPVYFD